MMTGIMQKVAANGLPITEKWLEVCNLPLITGD
jgi:hypothetical protein